MPNKRTSPPAPSEDAVRLRAYLMWEADGRPDGRAEHYWGLAAAALARDAGPAARAAAAADLPVKKAKAKSGKARAKNGPTARGKKKGA